VVLAKAKQRGPVWDSLASLVIDGCYEYDDGNGDIPENETREVFRYGCSPFMRFKLVLSARLVMKLAAASVFGVILVQKVGSTASSRLV
jgi:hypothetical protein